MEANPIQWAADLRAALKASGTGASKLDAIAAAMADRFDDPAHGARPDDDPDRHLTAAEAVAVLEKLAARGRCGDVTLDKARQLAATGAYKAPPAPTPRGDRLPPPPRSAAPSRPPAPSAEPALAAIAGPAEFTRDESESVGPKPVPPEPEPEPEPVPPEPATAPAGKRKR